MLTADLLPTDYSHEYVKYRVVLTLPWPPSVNGYWRNTGRRQILSKKAREYKDATSALIRSQGHPRMHGDLTAHIVLHPPSSARRDWDNWHKAVFDVLKEAGVYDDDCQVRSATVRFGEVRRPGEYRVVLEGRAE